MCSGREATQLYSCPYESLLLVKKTFDITVQQQALQTSVNQQLGNPLGVGFGLAPSGLGGSALGLHHQNMGLAAQNIGLNQNLMGQNITQNLGLFDVLFFNKICIYLIYLRAISTYDHNLIDQTS